MYDQKRQSWPSRAPCAIHCVAVSGASIRLRLRLVHASRGHPPNQNSEINPNQRLIDASTTTSFASHASPQCSVFRATESRLFG